MNDSIQVDATSPEVDHITLSDRQTGSIVFSRDLTVSLEAFGVSADAVSMRIAQDAGFTDNSTGWITYLATTEYTFTAGDGSRTAYYQVRDAVSNESQVISDAILIDTASPTVGSILLKDRVTGNPAYSSSLTVSLEASGVSADAVAMLIAQDAAFTENSTGWITYLANTQYTFTAGEGSRTVYYKVRDAASNESNTVNDGITIDTVSPEVDHITLFDRITGSPVYSSASLVTLEAFGVSADAVSMLIARDAAFTLGSTGWIAYRSSYDFTLAAGEGTREAHYKVRDSASNESAVVTDSIIVNFGPAAPTVLLKDRTSGSTVYSKELIVSIEVTAADPDVVLMRLSGNNLFDGSGNDTGWVTYETASQFTLTAGDGSRTVYAKVMDVASSESAVGSDSIIIDTAGPVPPSLITPASGSSINDNQPTFVWNVAVDPTSGVARYEITVDGTIAATLGAVTTHTLTGTLTDAAHSWSVRAEDNAGNWGAASLTWGFTVDTSLPAVSVIAPSTGAIVSGSAYTILWTATDSAGFGPTPITISLSVNGGSSWSAIAAGIANSGSYNWTLPALYSDNAMIRVEAVDLAGNTGSGTSGVFTLGEEQTYVPVAYVKTDQSLPKIHVTIAGVTLESGDYISKRPKFEVTLTDNIAIDQSYRKFSLDGVELATTVVEATVNRLKFSAEPTEDLADESVKTHSLAAEGRDRSNGYAGLTIDNLKVAVAGGAVGVVGGKTTVFPMPFSSSMDKSFGVSYNLTKDAQVQIMLISGGGQQVITRLYLSGTNGGKAGFNQVKIEAARDDTGSRLSNGIYVIRVIGDYNPIGKAYLVVYN